MRRRVGFERVHLRPDANQTNYERRSGKYVRKMTPQLRTPPRCCSWNTKGQRMHRVRRRRRCREGCLVSSTTSPTSLRFSFDPLARTEGAVVRDDGTFCSQRQQEAELFQFKPPTRFRISARILLPFVVATLTPQQAESSLSKPR